MRVLFVFYAHTCVCTHTHRCACTDVYRSGSGNTKAIYNNGGVHPYVHFMCIFGGVFGGCFWTPLRGGAGVDARPLKIHSFFPRGPFPRLPPLPPLPPPPGRGGGGVGGVGGAPHPPHPHEGAPLMRVPTKTWVLHTHILLVIAITSAHRKCAARGPLFGRLGNGQNRKMANANDSRLRLTFRATRHA